MKKNDIWISIAIITVCLLLLYNNLRQKGTIKIDAGGANAELKIEGSLFNKTIISESQPREIHSAVHRPVNLSISQKQDNHTWKIVSYGPWGYISKIKIKNNQEISLRLGPPFTIRPKARKGGNQYLIEFDIIGQAGEQYQKYALRDNRRISSAKLTIIDEQENVLHKGQFQYG